ncbi:Na/Pi cotransporter family protein [Litoribacter alkaliphilus]|uniref:Na/Pi cotransporter family protein n=1 Tax=Litoribacter ruber TaxID=702568 RepID=A0AAP2CI89_9BACT|nr:Na/Pi symporter [Litoribacter alkaliphilus]MBS9524154.1 Na/Pi cotransporter family protein [Litoribacter alkaliphilus]
MGEPSFDFWRFLAGIGVFLFGMSQLETALKELAGKSFRKMLQSLTDQSWKGVLVGALITAVLQSSSLVTLMVLAFLGAKVINLRSSLGVILGANLGTTITAWIVATLGFKLSVADFSLPFLGLGSLSVIFLQQRPVLKNIGYFCIGFGLLFLGLDFMKVAIEEVATQIDFKQYQHYGLWMFLGIGIIVTALIQSSSAMMVIILSAVHAGVVTLTQAAAMVVGANIGTTITVAIGAMGGAADKKRLALAHLLFNLVTGLIIYAFIADLINLTLMLFPVQDALIDLVIFSTFIKLLGVFLFLPFLGLLEKWLKRRFSKSEPKGQTLYIKNVSTKVPEVAVSAVEKEVAATFEKTVDFIIGTFQAGKKRQKMPTWRRIVSEVKDPIENYNQLKVIEDELTAYHVSLQEEVLSEREAESLTNLMLSLRSMIFAAKDIKDIQHNLRQMENSEDTLTTEILKKLRNQLKNSLLDLEERVQAGSLTFNNLNAWRYGNELSLKEINTFLHVELRKNKHELFPVSTLANVIRQTSTSLDNLGNAIDFWKFRTQPEKVEAN